MTISEDKTLILVWPGGLEQGTVLRLDKPYVETKSQWQEQTDRSARWMGRDTVAAKIAKSG